ncbi:precorrin-2 dehydrogenase [Clostridium sp. CT7]|nr:precorrin-2 dehydrogenase [Clostridium sp. CT7]
MSQDNKKDILGDTIENSFICLTSSKIKLLIIGGGNAAFIKAKNFAKRGCLVTVVSKEFIKDFEKFYDHPCIKFIKGEYIREYIDKNHLVIIATDDEKLNENIRRDCDRINKLYVDCGNPEEGLYIVPYQKDSDYFSFSLKFKGKSPKTSKYIGSKAFDFLSDYEKFANYTIDMRNKLKRSMRKEVMNFICSDDFYFFYNKKKEKLVLQLFYKGCDIYNETCNSNKEK